jgi:hypothetical protein
VVYISRKFFTEFDLEEFNKTPANSKPVMDGTVAPGTWFSGNLQSFEDEHLLRKGLRVEPSSRVSRITQPNREVIHALQAPAAHETPTEEVVEIPPRLKEELLRSGDTGSGAWIVRRLMTGFPFEESDSDDEEAWELSRDLIDG